ncbi:endonuclease/exonuclease/phosphatase family protein [Candidatus Kaiserbacteria bacterium]|nr:MAG: endonuclease/exonuclease/phosphatase family protein [Candidatus Kaiserbacteria bacterium]
MKILCLNTWYGGKLKNEITQFFHSHARSVDIFCLQETVDAFDTIVEPFLDSYTRIQHAKSISEQESYTLSILIRKDIKIHEHGTILSAIPKTGLDQWVIVERGNEKYWICNFHGIAYPGEKEDNPERLFASRALIEKGAHYTLPRIIMGDFNLLPTTESITMFDSEGYRDLIKEYEIKTTRNEHTWNRYPEKKLLHSDYAFVKGDVRVEAFSVLPDIVSDHQPLMLDVSVV